MLIISAKVLTLSAPIPDEEKKLSEIFIFTLLCGASKGFMKAVKAVDICMRRARLPSKHRRRFNINTTSATSYSRWNNLRCLLVWPQVCTSKHWYLSCLGCFWCNKMIIHKFNLKPISENLWHKQRFKTRYEKLIVIVTTQNLSFLPALSHRIFSLNSDQKQAYCAVE